MTLALRSLFVSALSAITFLSSAFANPSQITVGFIPSKDPAALKAELMEFGKMLQDKIHIPVQIYVSKDYAGLVEAMKQKKVDFAFYSASTFVFAEKEAKAKVLLKKVWDSPFYYSTIVTRADSGISSIEKLKGKRLAYVDEKSGSGYLYPQVLFKQKKIDPKTYFKETVFSGNHAASVAMLNEKKIDAIATYANDKKAKSGAWDTFAVEGKPAPKVKALWVSEAIPNDPFCVRQEFYDTYPRIAHEVMFGMIEMVEDKESSARAKSILGVAGLMFATSQQYEPVREMVRELDIQLK